jgi:hypothetical protein
MIYFGLRNNLCVLSEGMMAFSNCRGIATIRLTQQISVLIHRYFIYFIKFIIISNNFYYGKETNAIIRDIKLLRRETVCSYFNKH